MEDIQQITLSLYIAETFIIEGATLCSLHTIDKEWKEMEVTWNDAMKDIPWKMYPASHNDDSFSVEMAGDMEIDPIASPLSKNVNEWQVYDVTSSIKDYVENPENNNGFMIRNSSEQQPHIYFSSEYEDISKRPKLTFSTTTPITNTFTKKTNGGISVKPLNRDFEITVPFNNSYDIKIFSLNGKKVVNLTNKTEKKMILKNDLFSSGVNIVSISYSGTQHNLRLFKTN